MAYLSLDLGTKLGWALYQDGNVLSGTKKLDPLDSGEGARLENFFLFLANAHSKYEIEEIYFEKVLMMFKGGFSSINILKKNFYLEAVLKLFCHTHQILLKEIPVQTLKKKFLGSAKTEKGKSKFLMCAKAHDLGWPGGVAGTDKDNDEADAWAILYLFLKEKGIDIST